jgi:hypothetical protein
MDLESVKIVTAVAQVLTAVCAALIAYFSYTIAIRNLYQAQQTVYLKFYEIVQRHHTQEITDLRSCVYSLASKVAAALQAGKTLREQDEAFHSKISALANYYESLGMFLQYRWTAFPQDARTMMLAMLHNSVSNTWPLIDQYKDAIYSNRPRDWAQSFRWLHDRVQEYQKLQQRA